MVRGRVVTSLGTGLMGVRVSTSINLEGFTLTRDDGWFDLLVNGGGAVTLQFGRSPFKPQSHIVFVPWNEVRPTSFHYLSLSIPISNVVLSPCAPCNFTRDPPLLSAPQYSTLSLPFSLSSNFSSLFSFAQPLINAQPQLMPALSLSLCLCRW